MKKDDSDIQKQVQRAIEDLRQENQIAHSEIFQSLLHLIEKQREERIKLEVRLQYILQHFAKEMEMEEEAFGEIINGVYDFVEVNWEDLKKEIHDLDSLRRQIDAIGKDKFKRDVDTAFTEEFEEDGEEDEDDDEELEEGEEGKDPLI